MIYVEGKADQLLAQRLSKLPHREVRPVGDKSETLARLGGEVENLAMVDEDPTEAQPIQLFRMQSIANLTDAGLKVYADRRRGNRVIVICPRLEDWLIAAAEDVGIELPARRYNLPQNPISLHRAINRDLRKLERLIDNLITANSSRILKLQELLTS